jgi:hypothetical protein
MKRNNKNAEPKETDIDFFKDFLKEAYNMNILQGIIKKMKMRCLLMNFIKQKMNIQL